MQTYLVHMREPARLWSELGARRFIGFQVLMGGMILSSLVHPWFYVLLAIDLWQGRLLGVPDSVFGQWLLGIGIFNLIAGYVSAIALGTVAAARRGRLRLAAHALMMPIYWLGFAFAAYFYLTLPDVRPLRTTKGLKAGGIVDVQLADGRFGAEVKEVKDGKS